MKVKGHLVVAKGYGLVISACQWKAELIDGCDEYNREYMGSEFHTSAPREKAVVTVEFEVPDSLFDAPKDPKSLRAKIIDK